MRKKVSAAFIRTIAQRRRKAKLESGEKLRHNKVSLSDMGVCTPMRITDPELANRYEVESIFKSAVRA